MIVILCLSCFWCVRKYGAGTAWTAVRNSWCNFVIFSHPPSFVLFLSSISLLPLFTLPSSPSPHLPPFIHFPSSLPRATSVWCSAWNESVLYKWTLTVTYNKVFFPFFSFSERCIHHSSSVLPVLLSIFRTSKYLIFYLIFFYQVFSSFSEQTETRLKVLFGGHCFLFLLNSQSLMMMKIMMTKNPMTIIIHEDDNSNHWWGWWWGWWWQPRQ